jgi:hypothetical protein
VQALMSEAWATWFPRVCISYATGSRPGIDARGAGPGMMQCAQITRALHGAGIECASGLCVPVGANWKDFLTKINGRFANCEVLICLLSPGFYRSTPCLSEVYAAAKSLQDKEGKMQLMIPLRCGDELLGRNEQWPDTGPEDALMLGQVQDNLSALNVYPPRGAFFDSDPETTEQHLAHLVEEVQRALSSHATA